MRDGYGIKLLQELGVEIAVLSGGDVRSGRDRCASLGIKRAYFGIADKVAAFRDVAGALGLGGGRGGLHRRRARRHSAAQQVGFAATVPDAVDEVKAVVHYVTRRPGGDGAVRELCDLIRAHRP